MTSLLRLCICRVFTWSTAKSSKSTCQYDPSLIYNKALLLCVFGVFAQLFTDKTFYQGLPEWTYVCVCMCVCVCVVAYVICVCVRGVGAGEVSDMINQSIKY